MLDRGTMRERLRGADDTRRALVIYTPMRATRDQVAGHCAGCHPIVIPRYSMKLIL
jgi:hypothetical protein